MLCAKHECLDRYKRSIKNENILQFGQTLYIHI